MRVDDSNNYTTISYAAEGGYTGDFWNFGKEIWCNKEGQYTTIVADFKHLANKENFNQACAAYLSWAQDTFATPILHQL